MASAARLDDLPVLLGLVSDTQYGTARQMIVDSLWRFRKSPLVEPALVSLITDPAVALHAMSALRRSIGPASALPYLRQEAARAGAGSPALQDPDLLLAGQPRDGGSHAVATG